MLPTPPGTMVVVIVLVLLPPRGSTVGESMRTVLVSTVSAGQ
jgi:hypothetical protein